MVGPHFCPQPAPLIDDLSLLVCFITLSFDFFFWPSPAEVGLSLYLLPQTTCSPPLSPRSVFSYSAHLIGLQSSYSHSCMLLQRPWWLDWITFHSHRTLVLNHKLNVNTWDKLTGNTQCNRWLFLRYQTDIFLPFINFIAIWHLLRKIPIQATSESKMTDWSSWWPCQASVLLFKQIYIFHFCLKTLMLFDDFWVKFELITYDSHDALHHSAEKRSWWM